MYTCVHSKRNTLPGAFHRFWATRSNETATSRHADMAKSPSLIAHTFLAIGLDREILMQKASRF
ncbi:hypothetical protein MPLSOD_10513 [Mesorhizobium sp. SOD10]|nr:hypothetical protein MPLSOD_10513 [Mesorhizobium sp. SOD10]